MRASSSKQRPDEQEESEDDLWRERETRPASDRFGRRPRTKVHDGSPKRFVSYPEKTAKEQLKKEKTRKEQRSRSRQERRESPESVKIYCDDECKVEERNEKGRMMVCGRLCDRKDEHDVKDCECKNHIRQRETDEARKETRFRHPKEDVTDEERETRLTQKEKRILKKAHDIS